MDFISTSAMEKYEKIINEINKEYEKSKLLTEELEQANNNIVIQNLLKSHLIQHVSHTNVQIYSDLSELCALYKREISESSEKLPIEENCMFYLVQIFISEEFLSKLRVEDWLVSVCVESNSFSISKSLKLKGNTLFTIFTIPESIVNCTVESYLINTINDGIFVKLEKVDVDISYHFQKFKRKPNLTLLDGILHLTNCYNKDLDFKSLKKLPLLSYELKLTELSKEKFVETIIQNSFQNLDLEMFTDLQNDNKREFTLQICCFLDKIEFSYNKTDTITLKSNFINLEMLKRYFIKALHQNNEDLTLTNLEEIKNMTVLNIQDAKTLYCKLRKFSSYLLI